MGWIHNHIHVNHNQFHIAGLIISHTFQNTMMSTFPVYTSCIEKNIIFHTVYSRCVSHLSSGRGTPAAATLFSEVRGIQVQPAPVCQCQSFIQSPSTETIACKNDRREFKNNGDNLQQTLHSKKLRGLFKHLQIFAMGI